MTQATCSSGERDGATTEHTEETLEGLFVLGTITSRLHSGTDVPQCGRASPDPRGMLVAPD